MPEANESIAPFTLLGGILYLNEFELLPGCRLTLAGISDDCGVKPYLLIW
ncbi:hypothetical protein [Bifidobacterium longum]|nr:hypothetical protein [Bifidobacterium longum]